LEWTILNSKESHYPLVDRATSGLYAPGSTFKLVSSFAAVTAGVRGQFVGFDDSSGCYTSKYASDQKKKCNAGLSGTGANVDLATALTRSSDTYFYSVGDELWNIWRSDKQRGNAIQQWLAASGSAPRRGSHSPSRRDGSRRDLAAQLRVGASQEGIEPYKSNAAGYINWNPGDNMNTAVGQGDVLVTPLQLADAYAAFANGGTLWQPHLPTRFSTARRSSRASVRRSAAKWRWMRVSATRWSPASPARYRTRRALPTRRSRASRSRRFR